MQIKVVVHGLASGSNYYFPVNDQDLNLTLMDFLLKNDIRIASSCSGEGVCKKCIVNESIISCQISLLEFLKSNQTVIVSYL